jgi:hypothetical protein
MYNWTTLNTRVFKKLGFTLPKEAMEGAVFAQAGEIEPILKLVRTKLALYQAKHGQERAAHIPLVSTGTPGGDLRSPEGVHGILSRGVEQREGGEGAHCSFHRSQFGAGATAGAHSGGVSKVLDYTGDENDGGNDNERGGNNAAAVFIQSFHGGAAMNSEKGSMAVAAVGLAGELEDLRALNQVLEVKTAKLEQLLRLKDAKIAALTARLQGAGLLSPPPPPPPMAAVRNISAGVDAGM